jgi:hypothetical protein
MVEFKIKIHPQQRLTRIPKILAENFGTVWTLVPNRDAAVIFAENADLWTVLESLRIIEQELQLHAKSPRRNGAVQPRDQDRPKPPPPTSSGGG